jgi:hypothetical protein
MLRRPDEHQAPSEAAASEARELRSGGLGGTLDRSRPRRRPRLRVSGSLAGLVLAVGILPLPLTAAQPGHAAGAAAERVRSVPRDPLRGSGKVKRRYVTYAQLMNPSYSPGSPVDDGAFAVPRGAAPPTHRFEGTLTLDDTSSRGGFTPEGGTAGESGFDTSQKHLPPISITFVQNGSYLVPAVQGLVITGSPASNYIVGPGRAWNEDADHGWTRAAFPLTLIDRNQNCTHNGVVMFLFDGSRVSAARYQVTAETCELYKWDMYGQVPATYHRHPVKDAVALENTEAAQVANQIPIRPIADLATDYPSSGVQVTASTTTAAPSAAGAADVKVNSVTGLAQGQTITVGSTGMHPETRTVEGVGVAGTGAVTTLAAAALVGATTIEVTSVAEFTAGAQLTVGSGSTIEVDTITSVGTAGPAGTGIGLADPLNFAHASGAAVDGSGVFLTLPLSHAYASGSPLAFPSTFGALAGTTEYGVYYRGVNYVGGCATRFGTYAFCSEMILPSYSLAKSVMASMAMEALSQQYGSKVASLLLEDYVPEMKTSPNWDSAPVTFQDAANMATGNYASKAYEADEDGQGTTNFLDAEPYGSGSGPCEAPYTKITCALQYPHHGNEQGYTWVYHTVDAFLLTQAETGFLQTKQGTNADLFDYLVNRVYRPLGLSPDALTTERTDNASSQSGGNVDGKISGRPWGGYGMFFTADDVAKVARLLNNDLGVIRGRQVLDRTQVLASLQRLQSDRGVSASSTNLEADVVAGGYRYSNGLWAYPNDYEVPGCDLRVPFMSGYGGITVAMMPNGATYYYFSDDDQFIWADAIGQLNKLSPMCAATKTTVTTSPLPAAAGSSGQSVTLTATVTSATRNWAPSGTVQFRIDRTDAGQPVTLNDHGQARLTVHDISAGPHSVSAVYEPPSNTGYPSTTSTNAIAMGQANIDCVTTATSINVKNRAIFRVGDTIDIGPASLAGEGADTTGMDEEVVSAITPGPGKAGTLHWIGGCMYYAHPAGQTVAVRNTTGGGFAASTSAVVTVGRRGSSRS